MKKSILTVLVILMAVVQSCRDAGEKVSTAGNEYVASLQQISSTFSRLKFNCRQFKRRAFRNRERESRILPCQCLQPGYGKLC